MRKEGGEDMKHQGHILISKSRTTWIAGGRFSLGLVFHNFFNFRNTFGDLGVTVILSFYIVYVPSVEKIAQLLAEVMKRP